MLASFRISLSSPLLVLTGLLNVLGVSVGYPETETYWSMFLESVVQ